jgi:glutathione synthase/RimK-type ligase-like ATP-grasp enzyme
VQPSGDRIESDPSSTTEAAADEPPSLVPLPLPTAIPEILPAGLPARADRHGQTVLVVVDSLKLWQEHLPALAVDSIEAVPARRYITDSRFATLPRAKVLNLCRSYRYQTFGYYVSLLATARGHRPLPSIDTIQDLKLTPLIRLAASELSDQVGRALAGSAESRIEATIHFGRTTDPRLHRVSAAIFGRFPAPFLRAVFTRNGVWSLESLRILGSGEVVDGERAFAVEQARRFLAKPPRPRRGPQPTRFELAILRDDKEPRPPSNERAIRRFLHAAGELGASAEVIGRDDYGRLAEFDALFIRETTAVNHHTYRFSRRAAAEGLVVIDDPESIVRCGNKVYLAELLSRHRIATPRTIVISRETAGSVAAELGFPVVIKQPDSAFSMGVVKYDSAEAFDAAVPQLFDSSDLLIAQAFTPTEFDWRIGVLDGQPLFACRYFMAKRHWQIVKHTGPRMEPGTAETLPVDRAPSAVVGLAVRAARLIGDGLYGVDLKVVDGRPMVIEINDNPNIDAGIEDAVLGDFLYERILRLLSDRVETMRRRD